MIEQNKGTLVDFQKLKVPKLTNDVNEIILTTTECCDFCFESKNKKIYNIQYESKLFIRICNNNECEII